jgi:putative PIN family toxin of toxin-antitoxin system
MRVMIDTNILISSILGHGTPFHAYVKAVSYQNQGIICSQIVDDLRRIFNRKFPGKIPAMEKFLTMALQTLELVQIPEAEFEQERAIRDIKDRTILRAAIAAHVDIILTGDKDFLESGLSHPQIKTAAEFIDMF